MIKKGKNINIEVNDNSYKNCKGHGKGCGNCFYGLGFLGSAIYYISIANGFWAVVLGILKAAVWPAFLVYHLLKFIGA